MKEITGNLFDCTWADAICITTNGFVKNNGEAVMGAGCAKEAKKRWPTLPKRLGELLKKAGNNANWLEDADSYSIWSFPVKHNWWEDADMELIKRSAKELSVKAELCQYKKVVIPRPGCGNGRLKWDDVKQAIEPLLDDRFYIIDFGE